MYCDFLEILESLWINKMKYGAQEFRETCLTRKFTAKPNVLGRKRSEARARLFLAPHPPCSHPSQHFSAAQGWEKKTQSRPHSPCTSLMGSQCSQENGRAAEGNRWHVAAQLWHFAIESLFFFLLRRGGVLMTRRVSCRGLKEASTSWSAAWRWRGGHTARLITNQLLGSRV